MKKFFRVLWDIIVILIILCIVILVLDCLQASHDPASGFLYRFNSAVRSLFPQRLLDGWDAFKSQTAVMFVNLWEIIRNKGQ